MGTAKDVRLGETAFVLSEDDEIVRTMVGKIEEKGYRLLNDDDNHRPHWFFLDEAVSVASERIDARQDALRKELRALARKRRILETEAYKDNVMGAPYRAVDLRDTTAPFFVKRRTRELEKIRVPETYLALGRVVYVVITPMTRSGSKEVYQPYKHFVLETKVTSVCFSPNGQVHYTFSTPFIVEEFFLSRGEAEAKLQSFSEPGTKDPVPFVSSAEEQRELEGLADDDIPF